MVGPLVAGAGAGIAASFVRVPTEVVKQRMQIGEFKSAVTAVRHPRQCDRTGASAPASTCLPPSILLIGLAAS